MKRTKRGFAIYAEGHDSHGESWRVQASSAAGMGTPQGWRNGPWCWLFLDSQTLAERHLGNDLHPALHLTRGQARRLGKALLAFADEGKNG